VAYVEVVILSEAKDLLSYAGRDSRSFASLRMTIVPSYCSNSVTCLVSG
jgi:hypothetical protein